MRIICFTFASLLLFSCNGKQVSPDFDQRIIDLAIETRNGRYIELPDLYGTAIGLPEEKDETLILAEKLKARGYKIIATKRDLDGLSNKRFVTVSLTDGKCPCEVTKTYASTPFVGQYQVSEKIKCE